MLTQASSGHAAGESAFGSAHHFSLSMRTGATPQALWALWSDVPGWPRWDVALERASLEQPSPPGSTSVGQAGTLKRRGAPPSRFCIIACEPGGWVLGPGFRRALPDVIARLRELAEAAS